MREDAGDVQRLKVGFGGLFLGLDGGKEAVVFDGVIDGGRGEQGIELALAGGGIVLGEDGLDDGAFGERSPPPVSLPSTFGTPP